MNLNGEWQFEVDSKAEGEQRGWISGRDLAQRIARGSTVIFLTTETYARGGQPTGWLPLKTKGSVSPIAQPPADLPADFDEQLRAIGY